MKDLLIAIEQCESRLTYWRKSLIVHLYSEETCERHIAELTSELNSLKVHFMVAY